MGSIPRVILSITDLLPARQVEAGDIRKAGFDSAAMFRDVGTDHLDFHRSCANGSSGRTPGGPSDLQRIHGVCNHSATESQVVRGDRVRDAIARVVHRAGERL